MNHHRVRRVIASHAAFCVAVWLVSCAGCSSFQTKQRTYETLPANTVGNPEKAKRENRKGTYYLESDRLELAERHFQNALVADVNYAAAHNNLGQVYLARHQLYLAAWEFDYAANLMPDRVEPFLNLGLVYETANRLNRASEYYEIAYQMDAQNKLAIGNLARIRVKQDQSAEEIHFLLRELLMYDDRPDWLQWAEELLATRYRQSSLADCGECDVVDETSRPAMSRPTVRAKTYGAETFGHQALPPPAAMPDELVPPSSWPTDRPTKNSSETFELLPSREESSSLFPIDVDHLSLGRVPSCLTPRLLPSVDDAPVEATVKQVNFDEII